MSKEKSPDVIKLGEYSGENIIKLFNILTERFPDYDFIIGEGNILLLYSLYSSSDDEKIQETIQEYFKNKYRESNLVITR